MIIIWKFEIHKNIEGTINLKKKQSNPFICNLFWKKKIYLYLIAIMTKKKTLNI